MDVSFPARARRKPTHTDGNQIGLGPSSGRSSCSKLSCQWQFCVMTRRASTHYAQGPRIHAVYNTNNEEEGRGRGKGEMDGL